MNEFLEAIKDRKHEWFSKDIVKLAIVKTIHEWFLRKFFFELHQQAVICANKTMQINYRKNHSCLDILV